MSIYGDSILLGGSGGGSENVIAIIYVFYPEGATCTCSNGTITLRAGDTSGSWVFGIPSLGIWTSTFTDGVQTVSSTVQVTDKGQAFTVTLLPTLLIRSNYTHILAEALCERYSPLESTWDGFSLVGQNGFEIKDDGSVNLTGDYESIYYDLGAVNTSVTNYMVFKSLTSYGQTRLITNVAADYAGYCPGLYRSESYIWTTLWGSDASTGVSAIDDYHCIAIMNDCSINKETRYFVDGVKVRTLNHSGCGRYSEFTATTKVNDPAYRFGGNTNIKYLAVVNGTESDNAIIGNMQSIMTYYNIA